MIVYPFEERLHFWLERARPYLDVENDEIESLCDEIARAIDDFPPELLIKTLGEETENQSDLFPITLILSLSHSSDVLHALLDIFAIADFRSRSVIVQMIEKHPANAEAFLNHVILDESEDVNVRSMAILATGRLKRDSNLQALLELARRELPFGRFAQQTAWALKDMRSKECEQFLEMLFDLKESKSQNEGRREEETDYLKILGAWGLGRLGSSRHSEAIEYLGVFTSTEDNPDNLKMRAQQALEEIAF